MNGTESAAPLRDIIQEAIEEWASTAFAPGAPKPNDPTLARYMEAKIHEASDLHAAWGPITQHSIITPERAPRERIRGIRIRCWHRWVVVVHE